MAAPVKTVAIMMVAINRIAVLIVTSTCRQQPPEAVFSYLAVHLALSSSGNLQAWSLIH